MDWVQWYFVVGFVLNLLSLLFLAAVSPNESAHAKWIDRLAAYPWVVCFQLPWIGRIMGWW